MTEQNSSADKWTKVSNWHDTSLASPSLMDGVPSTGSTYDKEPLQPSTLSPQPCNDSLSSTFCHTKSLGDLETTQSYTDMSAPTDCYTGHIKVNRYDFIQEETDEKRDNKMNSTVRGSRGKQGSKGKDGRTKAAHLTAKNAKYLSTNRTQTVEHNPAGYPQNAEKEDVPSSTKQELHYLTTLPVEADISGAEGYTQGYSKPQYSWSGQSVQHPAEQPSETYVIERPLGSMGSLYSQQGQGTPGIAKPIPLPAINTFTAPPQVYFSDYGYRGVSPSFFPLMYPQPGNFENSPFSPYLGFQSQVYPMFEPYRWVPREHSDFPRVIYPKPMVESMMSSIAERQAALSAPMPYPDPTAMFKAANLIPSYSVNQEYAKYYQQKPAEVHTSRDTLGTGGSLLEAHGFWAGNQSMYPNGNTQQTITPQTPWLKSDGSVVNYNVAAAPSEVMTYLPQTPVNSYDDSPVEKINPVNKPKEEVKIVALPTLKDHLCNICGKTYVRAFTLKTHQRIHTGEKPFKCTVCQKHFAQASGLDSHKRVHTGEKPYQCHICARAFSHSSAVTSHIRTHTGERPFNCTSCGKHFGDQSTLKKHIRVHTGEKPFKCYLCQYTFTQVGNLNKHLRNVHRESKSEALKRSAAL